MFDEYTLTKLSKKSKQLRWLLHELTKTKHELNVKIGFLRQKKTAHWFIKAKLIATRTILLETGKLIIQRLIIAFSREPQYRIIP